MVAGSPLSASEGVSPAGEPMGQPLHRGRKRRPPRRQREGKCLLPSISGRGGVGVRRGKSVPASLLLLGPKSTDPNLEAEAPFVAVWLKESEVRPGNRLRCIFACSEGAGTFGAYSQLRCPSGLGVVRPTSSSSILREWTRSTCYGGLEKMSTRRCSDVERVKIDSE